VAPSSAWPTRTAPAGTGSSWPRGGPSSGPASGATTPGPYQIQAAIAALHSVAETSADTDWGRIVALYDHLLALAPTPVAALNRAIAVGERDGPAAALAALDALAEALDGYYLLHAARGDTLDRLGRHDEAAEAFERAMALTTNAAEIELLRSRREPAGH
jgi:RNA polymerase sigma-70 factor, ECF subfamily